EHLDRLLKPLRRLLRRDERDERVVLVLRERSAERSSAEARDELIRARVLAELRGVAAEKGGPVLDRVCREREGCGLVVFDDDRAERRARRAVREAELERFGNELVRGGGLVTEEIGDRIVVLPAREPSRGRRGDVDAFRSAVVGAANRSDATCQERRR